MIRNAPDRPEERTPGRTGPGLAPGDVVEVAVTDVLQNGQGVGRTGGVVVFAWGPLPGERARVRITAVKPKYAVAEVVELLERSPERVEPVCPLFGTCGGCQLQHLAYPAQLAWKQSSSRSALAASAPSATWRCRRRSVWTSRCGYRNKAALVVRDDDGSVDSASIKRARTTSWPVERCPVVTPLLDEMIAGLWKAARDPEAAAAFADARHVVTRAATASPEAVVSITTERRSRPSLARPRRCIACCRTPSASPIRTSRAARTP